MITDSRKIHIIEAVLNTSDETLLSGVEALISNSREPAKKANAYDFAGLISKEDIELMEKAIEEGCEQIHPDDWK